MLERSNIVCIDVETGGKYYAQNPITQIALQSFNISDLKEISRWDSYVKGYGDLKYEDEAMKYTGITMSEVESGLTSKEAVDKLIEEFTKANTAKKHTKKPILLGHNVMFDIGFIVRLFNFHKVDISKYLHTSNVEGIEIPHYMDTMWMSREMWGGDESMNKFTLQACCEKANVALVDAHQAQNDVSATKELFFFLTNRMRSGMDGESGGDVKRNRVRDSFQF